MSYCRLSVAIPMLAELDNIDALVDALSRQSAPDFDVYCCVNNPEEWAADPDNANHDAFLDNMATLDRLASIQASQPPFPLTVIDRASPGVGWTGKRKGVGWARKTLFDAIANDHGDDTVIVSLDADTQFPPSYLLSLLHAFNNAAPDANAIAVPYYHPLSNASDTDRAMLRYEIYMRHYMLSMMDIRSPYAFSALGSAMAFPLRAYRRVGGITPLQGGEDFYLMQKFVKAGRVLLSCGEQVMPQGRPSSRVPFGTGPAIAKGIDAMDASYPLYPAEGFRAVADTFALFPTLFTRDVDTPMSDFLRTQLATNDIWGPLRRNFKQQRLFVRACRERVDGLRILQFLKTFPPRPPEEEMALFCSSHSIDLPDDFSFRTSPVSDINALRDSLYNLETKLRSNLIIHI